MLPIKGGCKCPTCAYAQQEALKFSITERQVILGVLKRNEQLQKAHHLRLMRLRAELQLLRRKGALKASSSPESPDSFSSSNRRCERCRIELGRLLNRGATCRACRFKVCHGCREFSLKSADWVCIVCKKHMEIQAASGEWMNEYVRSRHSEPNVYVSAADIIKRTIRRSWTISNPSAPWSHPRNAHESRLYSSLPRHQNIADYPSLKAAGQNQQQPRPQQLLEVVVPPPSSSSPTPPQPPKPKPERINPLIRLANERSNKPKDAAKQEADELRRHSDTDSSPSDSGSDSVVVDMLTKYRRKMKKIKYETTQVDVIEAQEQTSPQQQRELCEIEQFTGTVFRKVTVRKPKRPDAIVNEATAVTTTGRRQADSESSLDGDEYKLVFISSDSGSSREEDVDDSSSTTSSFPIDECDWDYFEHGAGKVQTPPTMTTIKAKEVSDDDKVTSAAALLQCVHPTPACRSCGASSSTMPQQQTQQYVPIPVPVPIPIPMYAPESLVLYPPETLDALKAYVRIFPRVFWPMMHQSAPLLFPLDAPTPVQPPPEPPASPGPPAPPAPPAPPSSNEESVESESPSTPPSFDIGYLACEEKQEDDDSSMSSSDDDDEEDDHQSKVYVINDDTNDESEDEEDEEDGIVVLTGMRLLDEDAPPSVITSESCDTRESMQPCCDNETGASVGVELLDCAPTDGDDCSVSSAFRSGEQRPATATMVGREMVMTRCHGVQHKPSHEQQAGGGNVRPPVHGESDASALLLRHAARYTSLVMITQDCAPPSAAAVAYTPVSVVTTDTTMLVANNDVIVQHTNWQEENDKKQEEQQQEQHQHQHKDDNDNNDHNEHNNAAVMPDAQAESSSDDIVTLCGSNSASESVTVITSADTLSAVVCLEEGLADDDSWVENLSHDDEQEFEPSSDESASSTSSDDAPMLRCTAASLDHEEELRGYHRAAIDFTLHTIMEESCEESEVDVATTRTTKTRPKSTTDLEKYFYFGLADGFVANTNDDDDVASTCSESVDSFVDDEDGDSAVVDGEMLHELSSDLASSRLEKYFLSGFTSFKAAEQRRDSDGSVGSDSEGRQSPEQRRKRLVRARGTGRSHSSSLDNLLITNAELTGNETNNEAPSAEASSSSSSDADTFDEMNSGFDKNDGQFDTVKRKNKCKKQQRINGSNSPSDEKTLQMLDESDDTENDGQKTPQLSDVQTPADYINNMQSRDSGFIGSNDDLNKEARDGDTKTLKNAADTRMLNLYNISEERRVDERLGTTTTTPPATSLTRKDSFNNWSSDEETNLMMCKMRQFFKTMVANNNLASKPGTPILTPKTTATTTTPTTTPRVKHRCKPPQLVYFENELTRLMKTVPGIRDDQVREIVEYLSSEDTWSDSYDSSDYTSSDLECTNVAAITGSKSVLQQQISDSCKQIINKFDNNVVAMIEDEEGDEGDGGILDESSSYGLNKETAFVYQKLVASFEKMATGDDAAPSANVANSPPLIAKVMHHIGSRLVALMHEVSSGESHASNSPKTRHYHRRIHAKLSTASTTTEEDDDDSTSDHLPLNDDNDDALHRVLLPRSRSHDLLMSETRTPHSVIAGDGNNIEEREASDCERFSWRGSFESALLATDSRNKLSSEHASSTTAIAAKRRSAGDLLFANSRSLSREQLDRVRSCGSIGGANSEDKLWSHAARPTHRRRSSVPDTSSSADDDVDEDEELENGSNRSTLPRSLQAGGEQRASTNSLPRLPLSTGGGSSSNIQKAQSMYHFLQQNVKSARYRPPGFNRLITSVPKRAASAPGLQPTPQRRGRRQPCIIAENDDDTSISEAHSSPMLARTNTHTATTAISKSATPSPISRVVESPGTGGMKRPNSQEDIDRLVAIHHKNSLSTLGMRSDSMASVYSGAGDAKYGTVAVRGQVEFGLQYDYKNSALEINIRQCKDLAAVDQKRNRSDPYVKVYLLPDKSKSGKRKTKVKKHTLNPVFDESLKFHISLTGLETRTLWLTIWHSDMFGKNNFLGEVMMALEKKVFDDPTPQWYTLQERTEPFDDVLSYKGDILIGLKFVPPDMTLQKKGKRSRGALHVLVKEAKNLTAVKANSTSDPFCKSYLLPDKGRSSKQKTYVVKRNVYPVWNHTFVYDDVTLQELAERCLELTVWDHDRLGSNEFLGGVRFSLGTGKHYGKPVDWMDASGKELTLWKSMLARPNFWVEGCLSLRPSLDHRSSS